MIYKRSYIKRNWKMKIIHCADLHLDSKMTSNLSKEQAKERKMEILRTYSRMIEYAKNNDVKAIIIAGDLFDTRNVSATARNLVRIRLRQIRISISIILRVITTRTISYRSSMKSLTTLSFFLISGPHTAMEISQ